MIILTIVGSGTTAAGCIACLTGRIRTYQMQGLNAVAFTLFCIDSVLSSHTVMASLDAGWAALAVWLWWSGGGGDDTKRRLKKWRRAFTPTRRAAPAASRVAVAPGGAR